MGHIVHITYPIRGLRFNGYVLLPKGHVCYKVQYDDINVEVHGGLTFSEMSPDGYWKVGFDTFHASDGSEGDYNYRDMAYVFAECEKLAFQLKELNK